MTTLVTAAQIADLRRMVAEPTAAVYTDVLLTTIIEKYPMVDQFGEEPFDWVVGIPPTPIANSDWIATYDLNAAAADIWDEKGSVVAGQYDFSADGGNYSLSQQFDMYTKQARHYRARRSMKTIRAVKSPEEVERTDDSRNINNPYE